MATENWEILNKHGRQGLYGLEYRLQFLIPVNLSWKQPNSPWYIRQLSAFSCSALFHHSQSHLIHCTAALKSILHDQKCISVATFVWQEQKVAETRNREVPSLVAWNETSCRTDLDVWSIRLTTLWIKSGQERETDRHRWMKVLCLKLFQTANSQKWDWAPHTTSFVFVSFSIWGLTCDLLNVYCRHTDCIHKTHMYRKFAKMHCKVSRETTNVNTIRVNGIQWIQEMQISFVCSESLGDTCSSIPLMSFQTICMRSPVLVRHLLWPFLSGWQKFCFCICKSRHVTAVIAHRSGREQIIVNDFQHCSAITWSTFNFIKMAFQFHVPKWHKSSRNLRYFNENIFVTIFPIRACGCGILFRVAIRQVLKKPRFWSCFQQKAKNLYLSVVNSSFSFAKEEKINRPQLSSTFWLYQRLEWNKPRNRRATGAILLQEKPSVKRTALQESKPWETLETSSFGSYFPSGGVAKQNISPDNCCAR